MSAKRPEPRAGLLAIDAYVPGKSESDYSGPVHKLSSNETPLGPPISAREAYEAASRSLELYPDGSARLLREAIAAQYGLDPLRVVCGHGSDDLLHLLAAAYIAPGDEGILTAHGFQIFKIAILSAGGKAVCAPERHFKAAVDDILACVTEKTRIIFLANPNNPTGTYLEYSEVVRLADRIPRDVVLVLDGAYAEYVTAQDYSAGLALASERPNVVVTRTFSKIFGLASLRVGWAYAPEHICAVLHRIRGPFNVSGPALAAATSAVRDQDHVARSIAHNDKWRGWLTERLTEIGLVVTPSAANFVLVHLPAASGRDASHAESFLSREGAIVRGLRSYDLPNALRITIGDQAANEAVYEGLKKFMS